MELLIYIQIVLCISSEESLSLTSLPGISVSFMATWTSSRNVVSLFESDMFKSIASENNILVITVLLQVLSQKQTGTFLWSLQPFAKEKDLMVVIFFGTSALLHFIVDSLVELLF